MPRAVSIASGGMRATLLPTGDLFLLTYEGLMMGQLPGNPVDGMAANVYFRIHGENGIRAYPLMGRAAGASWAVTGESQAAYSVTLEDGRFTAQTTLTLQDNGWRIDISLENTGGRVLYDLIYAQDIGLGTMGHVRGNEAYNSQYLDHTAHKTGRGYVLCTRQNQPQDGKNPFLQLGCFGYADSFATDGTLFYGLTYPIDGKIAALSEPKLSNRVYQYEFAMGVLASAPAMLDGTSHVGFYGLVLADHPGAVTEPLAAPAWGIPMQKPASWHTPPCRPDFGPPLSSLPMDEASLSARYPDMRHVERGEDGALLSFFTPEDAHIVLMEKERLVERPHANILLAGESDFIREDLLTTTNRMHGVFHSHVALGNTSFNLMVSACRNALNVQKLSGQRVYLRRPGEKWRLLSVPAVYEMGLNYSRYLYRLPDDVLEVRAWVRLNSPHALLSVRSENGVVYEMALSTQLCSELNDLAPSVLVSEESDGSFTFTPPPGSLCSADYPALRFGMRLSVPCRRADASFFFTEEDVMDAPPLVLVTAPVAELCCVIEGRPTGEALPAFTPDFAADAAQYRAFIEKGLHGLRLSLPDNPDAAADLNKLNTTARWYSHNTRIHYAAPHGLEQYGGAAWGTRDVMQGPFEHFMALGRFDVARDILCRVYAHQLAEDGGWPQWFMYDRYARIHAGDAHGDVIVWPMKGIADYLAATGDTSILEEILPYMKGGAFTEPAPLRAHLRRQLDAILAQLMPGTALSKYGHGDWDDTLQPADPSLPSQMVSSWTVSLTYQVLTALAKVLPGSDAALIAQLVALSDGIRRDFHEYLMPDGVSAGFALFDPDAPGNPPVRYLLHPRDTETGLRYRLIPMTRSILSGLFTKDEAERHLTVIKQHLLHPDGARLMDTTCPYRGGVTAHFKRQEMAANFGREIGVMYAHAHIRYLEALCAMGLAEEAFHALMVIIPILNRQVVKNAQPGQSNCYFSSRDAMFDNRYEAMSGFDKLRTGDVGVKIGWRLYSSGPGMVVGQIIGRVLGLRAVDGGFVFDPVLPARFDGLAVETAVRGVPVTVRYHLTDPAREGVYIGGARVDTDRAENPYRPGGFIVPAVCIAGPCTVDVYRPAEDAP